MFDVLDNDNKFVPKKINKSYHVDRDTEKIKERSKRGE